MKTINLVLATSVFVGSMGAQAYEPEYLTDDFYDIPIVTRIADNMDYESGNRTESFAKRINLLACMIDKSILDGIESGVGAKQMNSYVRSSLHTLYEYYRKEPYTRDMTMDQEILKWVPNLEYRCIEYHPEPEKTVRELSVKLGNQDYDSGMCESGDLKCFQERVQHHRTQLTEEMNERLGE